jgi:hypothetical protein
MTALADLRGPFRYVELPKGRGYDDFLSKLPLRIHQVFLPSSGLNGVSMKLKRGC